MRMIFLFFFFSLEVESNTSESCELNKFFSFKSTMLISRNLIELVIYHLILILSMQTTAICPSLHLSMNTFQFFDHHIFFVHEISHYNLVYFNNIYFQFLLYYIINQPLSSFVNQSIRDVYHYQNSI